MEVTGAQAAYRVLDVLTEVALRREGTTAADVSRRVGLTLPTAHRLLRVLCDRGFALQDGSGGKYVAGPQLRVLAGDGVDHALLAEIAQPYLEALRDETDETVFISVRDGLLLTYLVCLASSHSVQMYGAPGMQVPLHATSQGKIILAFLPSGVAQRLISQTDLAKYTENTITEPEKVLESIQAARAAGYALNLEEREKGVRSVAAPVCGPNGDAVAAVCVGGPIFRVSENDLHGRLADLTKEAARAISDRLAERSSNLSESNSLAEVTR